MDEEKKLWERLTDWEKSPVYHFYCDSRVRWHIKQLKEETERENAAGVLGKIGKPAVPFLLETLKDKDAYVRKYAFEALAKTGRCAVAPLIDLLEHEDLGILSNTAWALGKIGDKTAVPALIEAMTDKDWYVQSLFIFTRGELEDISVVPALIEAIKDEKDWMRVTAARVLGIIGEPAILPLIEAFKDGNRDVRMKTAEAIREIAKKHPEYDWKPAVPLLIEALNDEWVGVRITASWALGMIKDVQAVPALIEALKDNDALRWVGVTLSGIFENCKTIEQLGEFQEKVEEGMKKLLKGCPGGMKDVPPDVQLKVANLMIEAAKRKNKLAPSRDILLDDIPKPPKKGDKIYRQLGMRSRLRPARP